MEQCKGLLQIAQSKLNWPLKEIKQPKRGKNPLSAGNGLPALMRQTGKDVVGYEKNLKEMPQHKAVA